MFRVDTPANHSYMTLTPVVGPGGKVIAVPLPSLAVRVYDAATGKHRYDLPVAGFWQPVAFRPDGAELATGTIGLGFWDVATGESARSADLTDGGLSYNSRFLFSLDGATVTGLPAERGDAITWDVATGRELRRQGWDEAFAAGLYAGTVWMRSGWHDRGLLWSAASPDGHHHARVVADAVRDENGRPIKCHTVISAGGTEVRRFPDADPNHEEMTLSVDGRFLISGSGWPTVRVTEIGTGTVRRLTLAPSLGPNWRERQRHAVRAVDLPESGREARPRPRRQPPQLQDRFVLVVGRGVRPGFRKRGGPAEGSRGV